MAGSNRTLFWRQPTGYNDSYDPDGMPEDEFALIIFEESKRYAIMHNWCTQVFDKLETVLLLAGVLGNGLALVTLMYSRQMRTPSFIYHKMLVLTFLIYCLNYLMVKLIDSTATVPGERKRLTYYRRGVAYYCMVFNRVLNSVCSYMALYSSSAIALDRFLALSITMRAFYQRFNKRPMAYGVLSVSLLFSVALHSWSPWLENRINQTVVTPDNSNVSIVAFELEEMANVDRFLLMAKDSYNLVVRFTYALLLTVLTSSVIFMFAKQRSRRNQLCGGQALKSRRQLRRERSLFYLMIAVVVMAYVQLLPRETRRILEMAYPFEEVKQRVGSRELGYSSRRFYVLLGLYGFTFLPMVVNLCTVIERSLVFYLYFALNHSFRRELLNTLALRPVLRKLALACGCFDPGTQRTPFDAADETTGFRRFSSERSRLMDDKPTGVHSQLTVLETGPRPDLASASGVRRSDADWRRPSASSDQANTGC